MAQPFFFTQEEILELPGGRKQALSFPFFFEAAVLWPQQIIGDLCLYREGKGFLTVESFG